jgi:hypothetical protein
MDVNNPDEQLELFGGMPATAGVHTRTLALWDTTFKYVRAKREKATEKVEIVYRPAGNYTLEIKPALVFRRGKTLAIYPGVREEMLVRALTYMAFQRRVETRIGQTRQGATYLCVTFALSEVRKILKDHGHSYSVGQISEAIEVCGSTVLTFRCETDQKRAAIGGSIFQSWSELDDKGDTEGKTSMRRVVLHPMVTESVLNETTRTIDFGRVMRLKTSLARWIYDRLSHNFTQATKGAFLHRNGYTLSLATIKAETGMTGEVKECARDVRDALHELEESGVLQRGLPYDEAKQYGELTGGRPPLSNVTWTLYPSDSVAEDIIRENTERRKIQ